MTTTPYNSIRHNVWIGDLLLFRRKSVISWASEGPYSHAALATWYGDTLLCVESREWHGVRLVTLSSQVRNHPGCIDVYRPHLSQAPAREATELAVRQTGHVYNYRGILWASILRMPVLRWALEKCGVMIDPNVNLNSSWSAPKFCSQLCTWAYRKVGFDPCPGLSDAFVTPNHLGHSSGFSLVAEGLTL